MQINRVSLFLALLAAFSVSWLDAVRIQPNRIVSGTGYSLIEALGPVGLTGVCIPLVLIAALALRPVIVAWLACSQRLRHCWLQCPGASVL